MARTLQAPVTVAFDYTRSTGPVLGRFFSGLRDGVVVGGRTSSGQVLVPPHEFDPETHEPTTDFVEVAPTGTVTAWSWCPEPVAGQPLDRPFAWAQVRLDGATSTKSVVSAWVSGSYSGGGTSTSPDDVRPPTTTPSRRPLKNRPRTGPVDLV